MMIMLCRCEEALITNPRIFCLFVRATFECLKHLPDDFFTDLLSRDNFLVKIFGDFFELVGEEGEGGREVGKGKGREEGDRKRLFTLVKELRGRLEEKFGEGFLGGGGEGEWEEDDEDAPVVVEL